MSYSLLKAKKLVKQYGERTVVNNVDIELNRGEVVGLLGPNGAGKTTTFYMLTGMIKPFSGEIFLDDEIVTNLPMYKRSQKGVGYLAQDASVFTKLSVEDNIKLVLEMTELSVEEQAEKLEKLIDEFSIGHIRNNKGYALSGGERRRLEIARSLVTGPSFILLDEPFAGIDPIAVEDIQGIINTLKSKNIGVLITDHNVRETLSITDRAYIINAGKIIASGLPNEVAQSEKVKQIYLGDQFSL